MGERDPRALAISATALAGMAASIGVAALVRRHKT